MLKTLAEQRVFIYSTAIIYNVFMTYKRTKKISVAITNTVIAIILGTVAARIIWFIDDGNRDIPQLFIWKLKYFKVSGVLIGGALGMLISIKIFPKYRTQLIDTIMESIFLSAAVGKIECFIKGCCIGKVMPDKLLPSYEIPHHADIIAKFDGLDKESAGRTSGVGFYYLIGDIARLHEAMLTYARDFMINHGFTYCIPPFMIRSSVVNGVMSFDEMEAMMYKIEGEDLYLIGTSEHSMIGRFKEQIVDESQLPLTLTSYSPCFRKEIGSHGLEERGLYRVHQFEKQEMIVLCKPEESMDWYNKMWKMSVELFRSLNIPVRQLDCCSGDMADLKVKSCDIEAWSPRQQKYFEVCSCSTLGDAQARRLNIRYKTKDGNKFVHTLNNTVLATPRALIALIECNYNEDGSITVPKVLQPYMGGKEKLIPTK